MWQEEISDDKRVCPFREKHCCLATFDSCRQLLAHCRAKHPDMLYVTGDPAPGLVVTDTLGKILGWEEIRQILDHPSFWPDPQEFIRLPRHEEVA